MYIKKRWLTSFLAHLGRFSRKYSRTKAGFHLRASPQECTKMYSDLMEAKTLTKKILTHLESEHEVIELYVATGDYAPLGNSKQILAYHKAPKHIQELEQTFATLTTALEDFEEAMEKESANGEYTAGFLAIHSLIPKLWKIYHLSEELARLFIPFKLDTKKQVKFLEKEVAKLTSYEKAVRSWLV